MVKSTSRIFMNSRTTLKRLLASWLIVFLVLPVSVWANPSGEQLVSGSATFNRSANQLDIIQGSNSAIIDWQSFSISAGETTKFLQPSAVSAVLNRVVSSDPSQIFGNLTANGQVFLVNQNGILVGASGVIDTNGFVASTLDVGNEAFLAGGDLTFLGASDNAVINLGKINGVGGDVLLIARDVQNAGEITATNGTVALATGSEVLVKASGAERVFIQAGSSEGKVENSGLIDTASAELKALGGNEFALAINNSGAVRATGVEERGGRIWLVADQGTVENSGSLTATQGDKGGEVQVLGDRVALTGNALVDVSGDQGGGTALIGGDFQGNNVEVKNAAKTFVGADAHINADAVTSGDGGKVIVWSDDATQFYGDISAKGGEVAGDGGFAEVSGKQLLDFQGTVDLTASTGSTGTLLLDPRSITIQTAGGTLASPFIASIDNSVIETAVLASALEGADVTVSTGVDGTQSGDITVANSFGWFSTNTLTMDAAGSIALNDNVSIQTFDGGITLNSGTGITQGVGSKLRVGGTTTLTATTGNILLDSSVNAMAGSIVATASSGAITLVNDSNLNLGPISATGLVTLQTVSGSNASIASSDTFSAGSLNATADGTGGISIANVVGDLSITNLTAGGSITIGDDSTGILTFAGNGDAADITNSSSDGSASGAVNIKGSILNINDDLTTEGGRIVLTSTSGAIIAASNADITTTADVNTGTASGSVSINAANGLTLQNVTTAGAANNLGVGSNAASVTLKTTSGIINVANITTSGGSATTDSSPADTPVNRNGGNAGTIIIEASGSGSGVGDDKSWTVTNAADVINLKGDLSAIGGAKTGSATQGLGGFIEVRTPLVISGDNRLVTSGGTSGDIQFLSTIDSDGLASSRQLTVTAGAGDVLFEGEVGGIDPLSYLLVNSSIQTDIEKNVTTDGASGVRIDASTVRLGDNDATNGSGTITIDTFAGNGLVDINAYSTYLDDAVTFTRGTGAIDISTYLYSNTSERNDLTFNGANGGSIRVGNDIGGSSGISSLSLGDILVETVTDLSFGNDVSAKSLKSLTGKGAIVISDYQYYDGAIGLQVVTDGTSLNITNDQNITIYDDIRLYDATAPLSITATNGTVISSSTAYLVTAGGDLTVNGKNGVTIGYNADITTSGGNINLVSTAGIITTSSEAGMITSGGNVSFDAATGITLGQNADVSTSGGSITLATTAGAVSMPSDYVDLNSANGAISISGVGVSQAGYTSTINAGSGKIRIDGGGGQINLQGTLSTTDEDISGSAAIIIQDAYVATASNGAVKLSRVNATTGTLQIGSMIDDDADGGTPDVADVDGDIIQIDDANVVDKIDIKTLEAHATGSLSITDTNNIIDELGAFDLGNALTVQARGRTNGLKLTGDVEATAVTIRTGLNPGGTDGILSLGTTNITATSGDVLLQGRGVTQSTGSTINAADQILILGSDYSTGNIQPVTLAGDLIAGSTATDAIVIDDTGNLIIANITAGDPDDPSGRGGLRLGTNIDRDSTSDGVATGVDLGYTRIFGTINQAAGSAIKVDRLSVFQESGAVTLANAGNEIEELGSIFRGGALTILEADIEGNGLTLAGHISGGIESNTVTITTPGLLNLASSLIYGSAVDLNSGSGLAATDNALTSSSGGVYVDPGTGDLTIDAGGSKIALSGALCALSGDKVIIENASDVSLGRVSRYEATSWQIGELVLGTSGNAITGNVTQGTGNIAAETISGVIGGAATLALTNYVDEIGNVSAIDGFTLSNNNIDLNVIGDLVSTNGNIILRTTGSSDDITVSSGSSIQANDLIGSDVSGAGSVSITAASLSTITVQGDITAGSGGVDLITGENISHAGTIETTGGVELRATNITNISYQKGISLGGNITAGDDGIALHSGDTIMQTAGILNTTGALYGVSSSGTTTQSPSYPAAHGEVNLTQNNQIAELGSFYLLDSEGGAFSVTDTTGGLSLTGAVTNPYGNITITSAGGVFDLASFGVEAGSSINGGANVTLTGRGINQTSGTISVNGIDSQGGKILLQGHDGTAAGAIDLAGTLQTNNTSANAITIRGTTDLTLPDIDVAGGTLILGGSDAAHQITGVVTQNASTSIDADILVVTAEDSVTLTNVGNKVGSLGAVSVGDGTAQYDFDLYDSIGGLTLTNTLTSGGGVRIETVQGAGDDGLLQLAAQTVRTDGDIYLSGEGIEQADGSRVTADNTGVGISDGGTITFSGGAAAIELLGELRTDNASATAIQILDGSNVTLNTVNVSGGTMVLGTAADSLTGTVLQQVGSVIAAKTLVGDVGILTLDKTLYLDELGALTTSGILTLLDQGGAVGAAGLTFVGDVAAGATARIETSDGVLDFATFDLDATGQDLTLVGVGIAQDFTVDTGVSDSAIKATTASIDGGTGSILLGSASNDFTGQVGLAATGTQVTIRDANALALNALDTSLGNDTSILAIAGTQLSLTSEDITTDSGNIDFRSLAGNLSTPGALTTGSGNVSLFASNQLNLFNSVQSISGNIVAKGSSIAHSSGTEGSPLSLQTGSSGTITVTANGTGGFAMGSYYGYQSDVGTISITSGGTASLANITSNGTLDVTADGFIDQVAIGSIIAVGAVSALATSNGAITLNNATNDSDSVSLRSRNVGNSATGSGTIQYSDVDGIAVDQIETSGDATLIAGDAVTTGTPGTVAANLLTVKTKNDAGSDITLTAANGVNAIDLQVRNAADGADAAGAIRFTDSDGFSVANVKTTDIAVLNAGGAVTQTGAIIADGLGLSGAGSYTLKNENNQFGTLASDATGDIDVATAWALTVGTVDTIAGITTNGANVAVSALSIDSSEVTIDTQSVTAGVNGGSLTLSTTGTGANGNLKVGTINTSGQEAGNVTLTAAGDVLTIAGVLTARGVSADALVRLTAANGALKQAVGPNRIDTGSVLVTAAKSSELLSLTNTIDEIAATLTVADASFTFKNAGDFIVGVDDGGVIGLTTNNGDIDLSGSGNVTLATDATVATTGGDFTTAGDAFTSNSGATIITTGGNVDLTGHTGAVLFGADVTTSGGDFTATGIASFDSTAVTLATTGGGDGSGGDMNITSTGAVSVGTLVANGGVDSNGSGESAGSVTLAAGDKLTTAVINAVGSDHNSDSTIGGQGGGITLTGTGGIDLGGNIDASGGGSGATQASGGSVVLNSPTLLMADRSITTGTGDGDITFNSSVDSEATETNNLSLTVGTGNIVLSGAVGSGVEQALGAIQILSATNVTNSSTIEATSLVQTAGTGTTTINGAITLGGSLDFTGQDIIVNSSVATGGTTQVHNAGTLTTGAGGNIAATGGFIQDGAGVNKLSADITTVNNNIVFATAVTLNDAVSMTTDSGTGNITFSNTIDSAVGETDDLTLSSGSGAVTFIDTLGVAEQLGAIVVNSAGLTRFDKSVSAASVYTDAPGTVQVNGSLVTTTGTQTYLEQLSLGADTTLTASRVTTGDTLTGNTHSLAIVGDAVFGNSADDQVTGLTTLSVSGTTTINTDTITSADAQTYTGAVTVGTDTTLTATDDPIVFSSSVDSKASGTNGLTVNTGSGDITFSAAVGSAANGELGVLVANSTDTTLFSSTVEAASVTTNAGGTTALNGGEVMTSGAQTYNDTVTLGDDTSLTGSTISTKGTVVGADQSLTIIGDAVFGDETTDTMTGLTTLSVSGTTTLKTDTITSSGTQTYTGAVTLAADVALTSGDAISFGSTVDGDGVLARSLRLTSANAAGQNFVSAVGGTNALNILRIESAGVVTQGVSAPVKAAELAIKSAGNVTFTNAGNDIDVLAALLSGNASLVFVDADGVELGTVDSADLQIVGISDGDGTSNVSITVGGALTQAASSPILLDGSLTIDTIAYDADDVALKNTAATGTVLDNSLIAGDFTVTSTGDVTQLADAYLQVGGSFDINGTGTFVEGNSSENLIGGGSAGSAANEIRLDGVITLSMSGTDLVASATTTGSGETSSDTILAGDLAGGVVVTSDAGGKSISTDVSNGTAVSLGGDNVVAGNIKITTKGTYTNSGESVATGILQSTDLDLAAATFFVQQSTTNFGSDIEGAGRLDLSNAGNTFTGDVSATAIDMEVHLREDTALELGTINAQNVIVELDNASSTLSITQSGTTTITAKTLLLRNAGETTLTNANRIGTLAAILNGDLSVTNNQALSVGTASTIDGIAAAGQILLKTNVGNLTLDKGITVTGASDIALVSAANFINNVGAGALGVVTGHWQVWSTDPTLDTLNGLTTNFKQYDATYGSTAVADTGNGLLYTLAPVLSVALTGSVERVYNADVDADLTQVIYTVGGLVDGDAVVLSSSGGSFDNKDVGDTKTITVADVTITSASNGDVSVYGYQLAAGTASADIGKITRASISAVTGITADNKVYDGGTDVTLNSGSAAFTGIFGDDELTVDSVSGAFSDKNVADDEILVNITEITLSGDDAGNYTLANNTATTTADIDPYSVSLTGSRTYDGTNVVANDIFTLGTLVGTEDLGLSGSGTLASKNVVTDGVVTLDSLALVDGSGLASNYTFTGDTQTASITPAALTVSASGINRVYDASTDASVNLTDDRIGTDELALSYGSAAFNDRHVADNKDVNVATINVTGTDAGNYTFNTSAVTTANITPAALTVSASGINRVYDATTDATVGLSDDRLGTDVLELSYDSAAFEDKDVADNKNVNVSTINVTGTDAGNYTFNTSAVTTANITPAALTVSASGINRVYDATTDATVGLSDDRLGTDELELSYGSAAFDDRHVADNKNVNVAAINVTGTDALNYTFNTTASSTANITPAALTITAKDDTKTYDTQAYTGGNDVNYSGFVSTEDERDLGGSISYSGSAQSAIGAGRYIITPQGLTSGNYAITFNDGHLTVDKAMLNYVAVLVSREYGEENPVTSGSLTGFAGEDNVSDLGGSVNWATGTIVTSNAGSYDITGSGYSSGNYAFAQATGNATALTIDKATLTYASDINTIEYGDANPTLSGTISGFKLGQDTSVLSGSEDWVPSSTATSDVGIYGVTGTGYGSVNYNFIQAADNSTALIVERASLIYAADAIVREYGGANPTLVGTIAGLKNGELMTDVTSGEALWMSNASSASNVGFYPVYGIGLTVTDSNYNAVIDQAIANETAFSVTPATGNVEVPIADDVGVEVPIVNEGGVWQVVNHDDNLVLIDSRNSSFVSIDEKVQTFLDSQMDLPQLPLLQQLPAFKIEFKQSADFSFGGVISSATGFADEVGAIDVGFGAYFAGESREKQRRRADYLD